VNESKEEKDAEWCNAHIEVSSSLVTPYGSVPSLSASAWSEGSLASLARKNSLSGTGCHIHPVHVAKGTEDDLHFHHSLVCGLSPAKHR